MHSNIVTCIFLFICLIARAFLQPPDLLWWPCTCGWKKSCSRLMCNAICVSNWTHSLHVTQSFIVGVLGSHACSPDFLIMWVCPVCCYGNTPFCLAIIHEDIYIFIVRSQQCMHISMVCSHLELQLLYISWCCSRTRHSLIRTYQYPVWN